MKITLLLTGGTIDKKYNELTGELDYGTSHMNDLLTEARNRAGLEVKELMLLDSLDMTEQQRQEVLEACQNEVSNRIVITHGTDTIVETATLLGQNITDKTIVLFGSMIPYAFGGSDALFNMGSALAAVQILSPGVYITMNGKVFAWDNVIKNRELGEFQTKS